MADAVEARAPGPRPEPAVEHGHGGFGRLFGALQKSPFYRIFWFGNQASLLVVQMQNVAVGYLAFELTNSATILGIVSLAAGLPMLVFSPVAGVIADRYPKRNLLLLVQAVLCLNSVVVGTLITVHWIQWWHLMVAGFIQGTCFSLNMPARQSWIPSLVVPSELPNAIALNNAGMNAARIVGPALAGLLIAVPWVGVNGIFYFSVPAVAWVYYSLLQIPILGLPEEGKRASFWSEFSTGMRYIWGHETLQPLFTLAVVTLLLGMSYQMLLPAYALGVFNVGSEGLGLMSAVVGAGALTGSLLMAYFSRSRRKGRIQAIAGTSLGLGLFLFGVASGVKLFPFALLVLLGVGVATDFYSTINNTLILVNTDRALFGRVMSVYMMTWSLSNLAAAPFGTMVDRLGGPLTMMLIGGFLAVFVVAMTRLHPGFRKVE
ncbi:MAG TPA: MFS transporter [Chloroflexota bacterium]|nr:MFS transporter [Chloroflexota bacterium]